MKTHVARGCVIDRSSLNTTLNTIRKESDQMRSVRSPISDLLAVLSCKTVCGHQEHIGTRQTRIAKASDKQKGEKNTKHKRNRVLLEFA